MAEMEGRLRAELRQALAGRPPEPATALDRALRRGRRRRAATRAAVGAGIAAVLAAAVAIPSPLRGFVDPGPAQTVTTSSRLPSDSELRLPCPLPASEEGMRMREERAQSPDSMPESITRYCTKPAFTVRPATAAAGTTVTASGRCPEDSGSATVNAVSITLSRAGSRSFDARTRPNRSFQVPLRLPARLLPGQYALTLTCGKGAKSSGHFYLLEGRVQDGHRTLTITKAAHKGARGIPDPAGLTATLDQQGGTPTLVVRGHGCFLPQLDGARGNVRLTYTRPGQRAGINALTVGYFGADPRVMPDGSWTYTDPAPNNPPEPGPYEIRAFCVDDLYGVGFAYQAVYRVDGGRLSQVAP